MPLALRRTQLSDLKKKITSDHQRKPGYRKPFSGDAGGRVAGCLGVNETFTIRRDAGPLRGQLSSRDCVVEDGKGRALERGGTRH